MMRFPILFLAVLSFLVLSGCNKPSNNILTGIWSSNNTTLLLTEEGKFSIRQGKTVSTGEFELLNNNKTLVFAYKYGNALRSIATSFSVSKDGQTLAIDRTCFGTQVLAKVSSDPSHSRIASDHKQEAPSKINESDDLNWQSFSNRIVEDHQEGEKIRQQDQGQNKGVSLSTSGMIDQTAMVLDNKGVRFVFPKPNKPDAITYPMPQEWPQMGLKSWTQITMGVPTGT